MSSLSNFSARELEWLSAYADGELPPQEAEDLRARLEQDPGLRQALAEIQQTTGLLRSLPALKPPRTFTLSAERAAVARRYPRLQLATALAGLAFFVVVGADVFARTGMAAPQLQLVQERAAAPVAAPGMVQELPPAAKEQPLPEEGLQLEVAGTAEPTQAASAGDLEATPSPVGETAAAEERAAAPQTATAPSYADTGAGAAEAQPPEATPEAEALTLESQIEATPEAEALALESQIEATPEAEAPALELQAEAPAPGDDQVAAPAQEGDRLAASEPALGPGGAVPSAGQVSEAAPVGALYRIAGPGLAFRLAEIGLGGAALVLAMLTLRTRRRR